MPHTFSRVDDRVHVDRLFSGLAHGLRGGGGQSVRADLRRERDERSCLGQKCPPGRPRATFHSQVLRQDPAHRQGVGGGEEEGEGER